MARAEEKADQDEGREGAQGDDGGGDEEEEERAEEPEACAER